MPLSSLPPEVLQSQLGEFLPQQRWFPGSRPPRSLSVRRERVMREDPPVLVHLLVDCDQALYQVPVGIRPASDAVEFLHGHDEGMLGSVTAAMDGSETPAVVYDAVFDPELALALLADTGAEPAERVRLMGTEQSNTSLVYDEKLILKLFRRIQPGPNPEVEVTAALASVGFPWVAEPLYTVTYEDGGTVHHLAVVQPYLAGAVEGWALALTSLRDLFGVHDTQSIPIIRPDAPPPDAIDPGEAGGDFSADASRLGETTAELHCALAQAFGQAPGDAREWAAGIEAQMVNARDETGGFDVGAAEKVIERLRSVTGPGPSTRIHGDYHLGQVMRTDAGWYVLDFEGEPARPLSERTRPSSPLRDVAGMLRSFHYAAMVACGERGESVEELTTAWEDRNRQAFLEGYLRVAGEGGMLPPDDRSTMAVLDAFELEKALYELRYEKAHRPDWEHIPRGGLDRLLSGR